MGYKMMISPEFRIHLNHHILTSGIEVEVFSSRSANCDWCRVELTSQLRNYIDYEDLEPVTVDLGYANDFDRLISGYARRTSKDYWKEILVKDDMIKLDRTEIKGAFTSCDPRDIIRYILTQSGIKNYELASGIYEKKNVIINKQTAKQAVQEVNNAWGLKHDFFFSNNVFYWGCVPNQDAVYVLEEDNNILSFHKYGDLWEIETLGIPWIHHSQQIIVRHAKYSGTTIVEKTIIRSDSEGRVRMYLYFNGG